MSGDSALTCTESLPSCSTILYAARFASISTSFSEHFFPKSRFTSVTVLLRYLSHFIYE